MENLILIIKALLFFEGFAFGTFFIPSKNSKNFFFDSAVNLLAYLVSFGWVWWVERSRKIHSALPTMALLALISKFVFSRLDPVNLGYSCYFFMVLSSAMIVPLTCAFTMMQFSPRQDREKWSLQYVWFLIGKLARITFFNILPRFVPLRKYRICTSLSVDTLSVGVIVLLARMIPSVKEKDALKLNLQPAKPTVQIYTPISKLIGQGRYIFFLMAVILASVINVLFRFLINGASPDLKISPIFNSSLEILACLISYYLVPRIVAPQLFLLFSQGIACLGLVLFLLQDLGIDLPFSLILQALSAFAAAFTTVASAQIIATFAKPGLEYTTCALVGICKSGIAPFLLGGFIKFRDITPNVLVLFLSSSLILFALKYWLIDYAHDKVLIKNKY